MERFPRRSRDQLGPIRSVEKIAPVPDTERCSGAVQRSGAAERCSGAEARDKVHLRCMVRVMRAM
jgi:hypothetical protein